MSDVTETPDAAVADSSGPVDGASATEPVVTEEVDGVDTGAGADVEVAEVDAADTTDLTDAEVDDGSHNDAAVDADPDPGTPVPPENVTRVSADGTGPAAAAVEDPAVAEAEADPDGPGPVDDPRGVTGPVPAATELPADKPED